MKSLFLMISLCFAALLPWPDQLNYLFERDR